MVSLVDFYRGNKTPELGCNDIFEDQVVVCMTGARPCQDYRDLRVRALLVARDDDRYGSVAVYYEELAIGAKRRSIIQRKGLQNGHRLLCRSVSARKEKHLPQVETERYATDERRGAHSSSLQLIDFG